MGSRFGVFGFFVLSSFLLTYRFMKEYENKTQKQHQLFPNLDQRSRIIAELKVFCLITVKYAIRRFFRVLVPVFIFTRDFQTFLLKNMGSYGHQLWTIPAEIKYFFWVPFIALFFIKFKRFAHILSILGYILCFANEKFRFLKFTESYQSEDGSDLESFFHVFFGGSLTAVVYYFYYESLESNSMSSTNCIGSFFSVIIRIKRVKSVFVQFLFNFISSSFLLFLFHLFIKNYGKFWADYKIFTDYIFVWLGLKPRRLFSNFDFGSVFSIYLLMMLITGPNSFTNVFAKSAVLLSVGKYSYGMYLYHVKLYSLETFTYVKSVLEYLIFFFTLVYICGVLFYYFVENPLMNLANYVCKKIDERYSEATLPEK